MCLLCGLDWFVFLHNLQDILTQNMLKSQQKKVFALASCNITQWYTVTARHVHACEFTLAKQSPADMPTFMCIPQKQHKDEFEVYTYLQ